MLSLPPCPNALFMNSVNARNIACQPYCDGDADGQRDLLESGCLVRAAKTLADRPTLTFNKYNAAPFRDGRAPARII